MFGGLTRLLVAGLVAGAALTAVLAGPSAALACSGSTSAVSVYSPCMPSGGGGKHHASGGPSTSHESGPGANSTATVSHQAKKALKSAGRHRRVLAALQRTAPPRMLGATGPTRASAPSALGSAFDLGSGPTALLIVLAGTAFLLLGGSGLHLWRRSQRP